MKYLCDNKFIFLICRIEIVYLNDIKNEEKQIFNDVVKRIQV